MEYPGYGLYQTETPNCDTIAENSELVYNFLIESLGYDPCDILLMGRSMGSGPATHLASINQKIACLILLSPFTSLKDAVKSLLGKLPSLLVRDRFLN
jgi:pimeloyl-ACP methyl ester carboxylesterase